MLINFSESELRAFFVSSALSFFKINLLSPLMYALPEATIVSISFPTPNTLIHDFLTLH